MFSLWVIMILSILSVSLAGSIRQKILVFKQIELKEELRMAAESAIKKIQLEIVLRAKEGQAHSIKEWYDKGIVSGSMKVGKVDVYFDVKEESEKININVASAEMLESFLRDAANMGQEPAFRLAHSIVDFRDADDFISAVYDKGSEKESYVGSGLSEPKNSDFEYIAELLQVKGMTSEIFDDIKSKLTVYGNGGINLNSASPAALWAADLPPALVERILAMRQGPDGREFTDDDYIFKNKNTVVAEIQKNVGLSETDEVRLQTALRHNFINVDSNLFSVYVRATKDQKVYKKIACVFDSSSGIRYWVES